MNGEWCIQKFCFYSENEKKIDRKWIQIICREREREMWCLFVDEFSGQQQQRKTNQIRWLDR